MRDLIIYLCIVQIAVSKMGVWAAEMLPKLGLINLVKNDIKYVNNHFNKIDVENRYARTAF